jgi:hypothetical protein
VQFPVPQFTDVEDKIIAGLTFKQFAIIFGASVFTFIIYTISKNLPITIAVAVLIGIPSLALVFGKLNGRPLYASVGNFIQYLFGPKIYIYHKEGKDFNSEYTPIVTEEKVEPKDLKATAVKIKGLNYVLQQQQLEESKLIEMIKQNHQQS